MDLIKARSKPNAIATRAIIGAATGYQYWGKFTRARDIETLAKNVYGLLFGQIVEIDPSSSDVPRAGQPYSKQAFTTVLDVVNLFNNVTPSMWRESQRNKKEASRQVLADDDNDGSHTIECLQKVHEVARLAFGGPDFQCSLGFDPAVYCYGSTGKLHPAAYIAALRFAQELDQKNQNRKFTQIREQFEDFLVSHNFFITQLVHGKGSRTRPLEAIVTLYRSLFACLLSGTAEESAILEDMHHQPGLGDLTLNDPARSDGTQTKRKRFSKSVTEAAIVRQVLNTRARCSICKARLAPAFRSKDHSQRIQDGGTGNLDNLEFTHPYCNSGYKERLAYEAKQGKL